MTDYMTSAPAAGWYTDPSNPGQERWWGGVEWTHDTRPLTAPAPAPAPAPVAFPPAAAQPAIVNVPGGGINPFAAVDAQERMLAVGSTDFGAPAAVAPGATYGSYGSYGSDLTATSPGFGAVDAGWYDQTRRAAPLEEQRNGLATAGLILGIFGFSVLAIVLSALGLRKARSFEMQGELPVGRKRSRWGMGLGIISLLLSILFTIGYLFFWQAIYDYAMQMTTIAADAEDPQQGGVLDNLGLPDVQNGFVATDGSYDRASYEQQIRDQYAAYDLPAPDSVTCPDQGATTAGSVIVCTIVTGDVTETRTSQYYEDNQISTVTVRTS